MLEAQKFGLQSKILSLVNFSASLFGGRCIVHLGGLLTMVKDNVCYQSSREKRGDWNGEPGVCKHVNVEEFALPTMVGVLPNKRGFQANSLDFPSI